MWKVAVAVLVGFVSCGVIWYLTPLRVPAREQLVGNYNVQFSWGKASLQLRADGTFTEQVMPSGDLARSMEGKWTLAQFNPLYVGFTPFEDCDESGPGALMPEQRLPASSIGAHGARLAVGDPDSGFRFIKQ